MSVCTRCGHTLGVVPSCPSCGHPVDDERTATAERPAVTAPRATTGSHRAVTPRRSLWPLALGAGAALLLVAVLGAVLLLTGDDPGDPLVADDGASEPSARPTSTETADEPGGEDRTEEPADDEPADVSRFARVVVPATAPPTEDVDGNLVRFEGRNMLDGVPGTCWRMAGDGSGETIVVKLAESTRVTRIGLVNGYAKTSGDLDWYVGNRRVLAVTWVVGGTTVEQSLVETRDLQEVTLPDGIVTDTLRITLDTVSAPGTGRSGRDYTALSEVSVVGTPAR